jgi:hypothetical protein
MMERLIGGICLGVGLVRLFSNTEHVWFSWSLIGIGLFTLVIYLAERFISKEYWGGCKRYDAMTPEQKITDCERRIAEDKIPKHA